MTIRTTLAPVAALLLAAASPALADTTWSATGPKGGTAHGTVSCAAGEGTLTCNHAGEFTGPGGQTAKRQGVWTATKDSVHATWTTTGPKGRTVSGERTRTRSK